MAQRVAAGVEREILIACADSLWWSRTYRQAECVGRPLPSEAERSAQLIAAS